MVNKKKKVESYEHALQKAREQTRQSSYMDEEYDEVQQAIENQRRKALNSKAHKVEDIVRTLIETDKTANVIDTRKTVILKNAFQEYADAQIVELDTIDTSTDFFKIVQTRDPIKEQKNMNELLSSSVKDTRDGTTSIVNVSLPSEKILAWKKSQSEFSIKPFTKETTRDQDKTGNVENDDDLYTKEDLNQLAEEVKFIEEESFEGGIANALKAIREKGYLLENDIEIAGRSKDKTYHEEMAKYSSSKNNLKLEYRDNHGRLMTPKEAFRFQCRIFHGIKPSKKKQEKEKRKFEAKKKILMTAPQETASMKALNKLQQQSKQSFVVLNNKTKNE
jgi:U4/U6.U5 tri-snRNP-associated protein 1